uniref:Ig-like domain-containing protein n=1 Tax=Anopheles coluzzii TaxID=1518534 RepID=A0A8W7PDU2_ANOCL
MNSNLSNNEFGQTKNYGFGAIRSVQLVVDPPAVRRGQHATLRCLYDLDDSPLYSVKFYRGLREFYRYSPGQQPSKKIFPFPGINVDASLSDNRQVVIKNVGFGLSGNFSCEVTADAPSFSTATEHISMQVVASPEMFKSSDLVRTHPSTGG